jgi:phage shock protein PspC (stress-responsive transcriptional regulator)
MNKTIIININGIVFHIEEDAYEILKNYMTEVKRHFSNSADSLEITTDIENRIAEMFAELLAGDNKQVIVEQDVNTVIEQMGTVADFESADEDSKASSNPFGDYKGETRRLFRDPDDHLVAGVCAGIANYFDIDAIWIRLAFTIFTAFAGTGLLLYIILWIVLPKAVTRADRMAMKGEKQNLQGFKKNFEEELSSMKQNLHNFSHEARPFVYKARDFAGDFFHHFGLFLRGAGKVFVKLLGVLILLMCFSLVVFLIVGVVALFSVGSFAPFHDLPYGVLRHNHADYIFASAFIVAFIPLLTIILLVLNGIFNVGRIGRSTGSTVLVIWLCAIGILVFYCTKIAAQFRSDASFTQTINIKATHDNTYHLKLNDLRYFTAEDSTRLNLKELFHNSNIRVTDEDDNREWYHVSLNIERSDINQPELVESFSAKGADDEDALYNASNTKYIFAQKDSILTFDYKLRKVKDDLWHDEEVHLTLKLPLKAKVVIDRELDKIADTKVYDCNELNKKDNDKVKEATFIMTDNGLQCKVDTLVTVKKDSLKTDSLIKAKTAK